MSEELNVFFLPPKKNRKHDGTEGIVQLASGSRPIGPLRLLGAFKTCTHEPALPLVELRLPRYVGQSLSEIVHAEPNQPQRFLSNSEALAQNLSDKSSHALHRSGIDCDVHDLLHQLHSVCSLLPRCCDFASSHRVESIALPSRARWASFFSTRPLQFFSFIWLCTHAIVSICDNFGPVRHLFFCIKLTPSVGSCCINFTASVTWILHRARSQFALHLHLSVLLHPLCNNVTESLSLLCINLTASIGSQSLPFTASLSLLCIKRTASISSPCISLTASFRSLCIHLTAYRSLLCIHLTAYRSLLCIHLTAYRSLLCISLTSSKV